MDENGNNEHGLRYQIEQLQYGMIFNFYMHLYNIVSLIDLIVLNFILQLIVDLSTINQFILVIDSSNFGVWNHCIL